MQLRTPKRYTPRGRQRRGCLINLRNWWLWLLAILALVIGAGLVNIAPMLQEPINEFVGTQFANVESANATARAPTPTPTDSPVIYLNVANAAYQRGAFDEAIAQYELAAGGMPNDASLYYRLTHLLITNGRYGEALEWAERAINADPYDPLAWAVHGWALDWAGTPELGLASLFHALELDADNATARAFLAETYADMGKLNRALEEAEAALELDPLDFNAQRAYGYVLSWYGEIDETIDAYERALQLAPEQAFIAFDLANLYFSQGNTTDGVALLQGVIDNNPENARAHFVLALALINQLGQFEQSRAEVERCTAIAPDNVACLGLLGWFQLRDGEYNLCTRSLERAIDGGTTDADDYYNAAFCYLAIDNCPRAVEIMREGMALTDDPDTLVAFRDQLASCQVVVTLVPTPTPTPDAESVLEELEATPES